MLFRSIYYRNFWLLGNWTARHIVENLKVFGHASRTSRRMWVGRRNSEHKKKPVPTVFEEGLRIKEWLRRGERAAISSYYTHVSDPDVANSPPTPNCSSLDPHWSACSVHTLRGIAAFLRKHCSRRHIGVLFIQTFSCHP